MASYGQNSGTGRCRYPVFRLCGSKDRISNHSGNRVSAGEIEQLTMAETQEELARKVRELQKEVERLNAQLKEKRFGLTWIDVPEAFEQESENRIPVLEEVPELAINNNDGKPTHILIEGDNYHALTCLNYTHRNKIDVIISLCFCFSFFRFLSLPF